MLELVALVTGAARARLRAQRGTAIRQSFRELGEVPDVPLTSTSAPARSRLLAALQAQLTAAAPAGWTVTAREDGLLAVGPAEPVLLLEVLPPGVSDRAGASARHAAPHYWVLDPVWPAVTLLERHGQGYVETHRCTDPVLVAELPFLVALDLQPPQA